MAKGPALKSYGVQVAELAGLPLSVTKRAKSLLKDIESKKVQASSQLSLLDSIYDESSFEDNIEAKVEEKIPEEIQTLIEELGKYPLLQMSPLEAMNQIAKWKEIVERV